MFVLCFFNLKKFVFKGNLEVKEISPSFHSYLVIMFCGIVILLFGDSVIRRRQPYIFNYSLSN